MTSQPFYRVAALLALVPVFFAIPTAFARHAKSSEVKNARFFDTRSSTDFGPAERPLRSLLKASGVAHGRVETFCIVGYDDDASGPTVYIHWPRKQQLILWDGGNRPSSLAHPRRKLDLRKDVVAAEADIGGSTYLVTKAWVAQTLADCAKHGRRYRVAWH